MANNNKNQDQQRLKQQEEAHGDDVVVLMVPLPAQGHLNQLLHLSRLILSYNIPVHYVSSTTHNRQARLRAHGCAANIHFHDFEIPPFLSPPPNPNSKSKFPSHLQPSFDATAHLQAHVSKLLHHLSCESRKVVVIHDSLMGSVVQEIRNIPNAEAYTFHSVSAFAIYLYLKERIGQNAVPPNGVVIPERIPSLDGCFTVEFLDFMATQYNYHEFNRGTIYNTSKLIEDTYLNLIDRLETRSISGKKMKKQKHWALGPFNPVTITPKLEYKRTHFCLEWLVKQETNTVLYVSFGTTTAMTDDQIKELATGLKQSNQKFIWVLRDADKGDVFDGSEERIVELPIGFESSLEGMGIVVRDWAPQLEILAHPAIGGFMSHCGWNSCMESITMGVPIAAWPMHSDQPRNCVLITEILKIGCVVNDWDCTDEVVSSRSVESSVRKIMASKEGDEMRKRASELGESVRRSIGDGGVSRLEIDSFIAHITS